MVSTAANQRFMSRAKFLVLLALALLLLWSVAIFEIGRSREQVIHEAEIKTEFQAQTFAESTLSSIKRLDELILDLRSRWHGNADEFAELIRRRQATMADIAFQVSVIDASGYLAFSNLAKADERVYLGEREHFKAHLGTAADRLFLSRPVKGKVSGKWSLQFTRPIYERDKFAGVLVVSVSPQTFAAFHDKLDLGANGNVTLIDGSGAVLARYPDNDLYMGKSIFGPFLDAQAPTLGTLTRPGQTDGVERIYGYARLPEWKLIFFVGDPLESVLTPFLIYRGKVLAITAIFSTLLVLLAYAWYRTLVAREKMFEVRESMAVLVESSEDAIVGKTPTGIVTSWNAGASKIFGFEAAEMLGRPMTELVPEDELAHEAEVMARVTRGETVTQFQTRRLRKDGSSFPASISFSPIRDPQGRIEGVVAITRDITHIRDVEQSLREAKQAAEAANLAKSQFLATMSHEIRTPMNGIVGTAQLLAMPGVTKEEQADYLRTLNHSAESLLALLNDILDLSKIEAGRIDLVVASFDPVELVQEVLALFRDTATRKGLELAIDISQLGRGTYQGDAIRIRQMLSNLVSNAIKFSDRGTVRLQLRQLASHADHAVLEFAVEDQGIGIPADRQGKLFTPFTQADASTTRQFGGTGLGLSIVRSLAELMGGQAGLSSQEGRGSRFWFTARVGFELDGSIDTSPPPKPATAPAPKPAGGPSSGSILVVEDNLVNRKVIVAMLKSCGGFDVEVAENGDEACTLLCDGRLQPDLVLMDCLMPVMDGYTATGKIRAWELAAGRPRLPILALTANAYAEDRLRCLSSGMDDFLTKPLNLDALKIALAHWWPKER